MAAGGCYAILTRILAGVYSVLTLYLKVAQNSLGVPEIVLSPKTECLSEF